MKRMYHLVEECDYQCSVSICRFEFGYRTSKTKNARFEKHSFDSVLGCRWQRCCFGICASPQKSQFFVLSDQSDRACMKWISKFQ